MTISSEGKHPDLRRGDDADLRHIEHAGQTGQRRRDHEDEQFIVGRRVAGKEDSLFAVANGDQDLALPASR